MGNLKNEDNDDEDLKDLLGNGKSASKSRQQVDHASSTKMSTLNLLLGTFRYHLYNLCFFYPVACTMVSMLLGAIALWFLLSVAIKGNPMEEFGIIHHDHSNIQSKLDLNMGNIDHWCLGGDDHNCFCEDPLIPVPRAEHTFWVQAVKANRQKIEKYRQDPSLSVDVAFLGESIVEEMDGYWVAKNGRTAGNKQLEGIFRHRFDTETGATVEAVALGVAGDSANHVLWRLLHGELPDDFNPKVWWVHLGMNDLAKMKCSEEVVVIGVLRVVEEILEKKPDARVVINSLLPMTALRKKETSIQTAGDVVEDDIKERQLLLQQQQQRQNNDNNNYHRQLSSSSDSDKGKRKDNNNNNNNNKEAAAEAGDDVKTEKRKGRAAEAEDKEELKKLRKEEKKRLSAERKERKKRVRVPREKKDPVLKEAVKMKRYRPGRIRKKTLPLWTSIQAINAQLNKFAKAHPRVDFFDATDLFIDVKRKKKILKSQYSNNKGHPTMAGYMALEDKILRFLTPILLQQNEEHEFIMSQVHADQDDYDNYYDEDPDNYVDLGEGNDDEFSFWNLDGGNDYDFDPDDEVYMPPDMLSDTGRYDDYMDEYADDDFA